VDKRCNAKRSRHRQPGFVGHPCVRRGPRVHAAGSRSPAARQTRQIGARVPEIAKPQRYRLGERIGVGGMGEVFRATRLGAEGFARTVAIKRILPGLSHEQRFIQMFIREALIVARLCHPNIVSALDFERDLDGQLFLVLEFVDGVDLNRLLSIGCLPHAVVVFIACEILDALRYAHGLPMDGGGQGIVHRDLSPHNVLLSWDGFVKVADFGLAERCEASGVVEPHELRGKVAFMSPEQVHCRPLNGRSDLFSVGVMLWEMLTGEPLFRHEDANVMMWRVISQTIIRPGIVRPVASDLEAVVMRLLERDPARRFSDAEAARDALAACDDASALGRIQLERLLAERFPEQAPRARARSPVPILTAPARYRTETAVPPARPYNSLKVPATLRLSFGRWWIVAVAAGAALVALGGLAAQ
jgi:eukaryotic-like serine/threonine-protein kinase